MSVELDNNLRRNLVDLLADVPALRERAGRDAWLARNLPRNVQDQIRRDDNCRNDLTFIVDAVQNLQLKDGRWLTLNLIDDVLDKMRGTIIAQELSRLRREIQRSLEPPTRLDDSPVEEIVIGKDEKVPVSFLENGLRAVKAVARVMVPRTIGGHVFGTGWLIAPNLLVTNYHVIEARRPGEDAATPQELDQQARGSVLWFGYDVVGSYTEYRCIDLIHDNKALDYAVLRLAERSIDGVPLVEWGFLKVVRIQPNLTPGARLNVIQHPGGRVKEIALRTNFYIGSIPNTDRFHYLSDTEGGSSGSPVLDDHWEVVGVHHAWDYYDRYYKGRPIRFDNLGLQYAISNKLSGQVVAAINEGILIHALLNDLPESVQLEIEQAQEWE